MSNSVLLLFPILFGLSYALSVRYNSRYAKSYIPKHNDSTLYPPRYGAFFATYIPGILWSRAVIRLAEDPFSWCFSNILLLTMGLGILLLLLPALRNLLEAESCASLWLIPCLAFVLTGLYPLWTIQLPFLRPGKEFVHILTLIWLMGAMVTVLWNIFSHLLFRYQLLKNARMVEDEMYWDVWKRQLCMVNLPSFRIRLRISPDTQTPLSIGLLRRTTCLVLPERLYTQKELELILHHELVHISRRDSLLKFTMCLLAAFMWFNPLVWVALRVCSQDLELSCDEAVLYGRSQETRMEYARLLLQTAPKARGFTSCLSSAASSLRYRLKHVVNKRKRIVGSILIGFLCLCMLLGSMCTGFRYKAMPGKELLFLETSFEQLEVAHMMGLIEGKEINGECNRDQILLDYIAALSLRQTTERPDVYAEANHVQITVRSPACSYWLTFGSGYLRVLTTVFSVHDEAPKRETVSYYKMDSETDWEFLRSCTMPE